MSHGYPHTTKHLRHVTVGRRTRTHAKRYDPIVQGGQGHSDEEVEQSGAGCLLLLGGAACLAVWLAVTIHGGLP